MLLHTSMHGYGWDRLFIQILAQEISSFGLSYEDNYLVELQLVYQF
jgi:hypothetical protein